MNHEPVPDDTVPHLRDEPRPGAIPGAGEPVDDLAPGGGPFETGTVGDLNQGGAGSMATGTTGDTGAIGGSLDPEVAAERDAEGRAR